MVSRTGERKRSGREGRSIVWMPTSRSDTAQKAVHQGSVAWWCRPMWVNSSIDSVPNRAMPTVTAPSVMRAERSEVASEAAWNSLRLTSSRSSTAPAMRDSSTSTPATRCRKMVPASSTTDTRQARRWPRRIPRPRAMRASPAMATRAPAATLALRGRYCSSTWSRPRSGGVIESRTSMMPVARMAAAAQRRTRRVRRWDWRRSGAGGHDSPIG